MSWATCYSGSNNINFNFPPIMTDGRNYSSWQPSAIVNKKIQKSENIKSNWEYRQFLQHNASAIMDYNNKETCTYLGLSSHISSSDTPSNNVPHKFKSIFDSSKPGFGYCNSDLKNPYLSREQLNSKMISPSIKLTNYQEFESAKINKLSRNQIY
jgi:hypothetical protein